VEQSCLAEKAMLAAWRGNMKTLVIYDSTYGNTAQVARAVGQAIAGDFMVRAVTEVKLADLERMDLLVVGSPTNGGRPTPAVQAFLNGIEGAILKGLNCAVFDTRLTQKWVMIFGYAAGHIGKSLEARGAVLLVPPEPFFVKSKEGPLKEGEIERAIAWAKTLI
jgi:flavodoxin